MCVFNDTKPTWIRKGKLFHHFLFFSYLINYRNRQQSGKRPRRGGFLVKELEILEEKSVHFSMKMVSKESGVE